MSLTCDNVLDLISIYKDGAASESTTAAIEEHLKHCRDCRRYYKQYDSINRIVSKKQAEAEADGDFQRLYISLKRRHTLTIAFLAVCGVITLTAAIFAFIVRKKK
ncbi:MAG: zf-HC2 domain-containing protein [Clostridia bacterium]|nr:zf-HC2 domain-containing protein [Clostridia bacterium]NCC69474.1 zf-HC2 domain-containing protein [Clostridia bacterium]